MTMVDNFYLLMLCILNRELMKGVKNVMPIRMACGFPDIGAMKTIIIIAVAFAKLKAIYSILSFIV